MFFFGVTHMLSFFGVKQQRNTDAKHYFSWSIFGVKHLIARKHNPAVSHTPAVSQRSRVDWPKNGWFRAKRRLATAKVLSTCRGWNLITSGPPLLSPFINQAGAWELAVVDPVVRLHNLIWWNHFEWFGHVEHAAYIFFWMQNHQWV